MRVFMHIAYIWW